MDGSYRWPAGPQTWPWSTARARWMLRRQAPKRSRPRCTPAYRFGCVHRGRSRSLRHRLSEPSVPWYIYCNMVARRAARVGAEGRNLWYDIIKQEYGINYREMIRYSYTCIYLPALRTNARAQWRPTPSPPTQWVCGYSDVVHREATRSTGAGTPRVPRRSAGQQSS